MAIFLEVQCRRSFWHVLGVVIINTAGALFGYRLFTLPRLLARAVKPAQGRER